MKKQKYYVVWKGVSPGIYDSWTDCQLQTKGYDGAQYKSFDTREEAERAFSSSPYEYIGKNASKKVDALKQLPDNFDMISTKFFCFFNTASFNCIFNSWQHFSSINRS